MNRLVLALVSALLLGLIVWTPAGLEAQDGQWGTIKGRVVWPASKPVPVPADLSDLIKKNTDAGHCLGKGPILSDDWLVNKGNKGLSNVFVWLSTGKKDEKKNDIAPPIHPTLQKVEPAEVLMDQPICAFLPHAIALREGQVLVAKNSSPVAHNYKWTGNPLTANAGNNVLIPAGGQFPIKGLVADRFPVSIACNIHPWMKGWVRVYNHPYFAVTDANGNFEIKNAPAGDFKLFLWQGTGGFSKGAEGRNGEPLTVEAGKTKDLGNIEYLLVE